MPASIGPLRRLFLIVLCSFVAIYIFLSSLSHNTASNILGPQSLLKNPLQRNAENTPHQSPLLTGHVIAPKLGNETAKAELGRAAWKLLHTMMARFPDAPSPDEKEALKTYIHLFQRLYPCGECAQHFGKLLEEFPPQVSSRSVAAAWACHVHNKVNESLGKELFDCSQIGDFYDCGCADGEEGAKKKGEAEESLATSERDLDLSKQGEKKVELQKEGWTPGG